PARTRRPSLGAAAVRRGRRLWVPRNTPRPERPEAIIAEVGAGMHRTDAAASRYAAEADRGAAIRGALGWAEAGDTVVIAGKGHETYQIVGAQVLPFDDREVAREILSKARS